MKSILGKIQTKVNHKNTQLWDCNKKKKAKPRSSFLRCHRPTWPLNSFLKPVSNLTTSIVNSQRQFSERWDDAFVLRLRPELEGCEICMAIYQEPADRRMRSFVDRSKAKMKKTKGLVFFFYFLCFIFQCQWLTNNLLPWTFKSENLEPCLIEQGCWVLFCS